MLLVAKHVRFAVAIDSCRPWRPRGAHWHHTRGSVLLEQIVAITVLSLMVVGVFSLLTTGSLGAQMAREHTVAASLAAQKLEDIIGGGTEPADRPRERLDRAGFPTYEWQVDVEEVSPGLHRVSVTVWWSHGRLERSVSLTTLVRGEEEP